jgi:hypothetical protein
MPPAVAVGSSAYNLAGEPNRRPDFLKSQVAAILAGSPKSIGEAIIDGYKDSSAFRARQFLKWSQSDPSFLAHIGVTGGSLPGGNLDYEVIIDHVPPWDEDEEPQLAWNDTYVGLADPSMWVVEHMTRYFPGDSYTYTFDPVSETATITRDGEDPFVLVMPNYYPGQMYMYVHYLANPGLHSFWWIYRYGTGDAVLDAMIDAINPVAFGAFYPPIPFRYLNEAVAPDTGLSDLYPVAKSAFRRAFGLRFDDVQEKILDNESIEDIDYVYAVMAVTFNTKEESGRKYIFKLVEFLVENTSNHTPAGKANWFIQYQEGTWPDMKPPWKSIKVESKIASVSDYRTDLKWAFMNLTTGSGLLKPGARVDEVWFEVLADPPGTYPATYDFLGFKQEVALCWQVTKDSWKKIVVTGLQYNNYVYQTDHTIVTAKAALEETAGDSEFLVPLHEGIFDSLPMVDRLQVGTSFSWLVFNCFEVDKAEWYKTGWFKVLLVVVILAVSITAAILTGGTSLGVGGAAVAGILTGSGLGLTAALIIAAAVDVIAGILISYLISMVANELFGPKWGPLIGAIVSFVFSFGMNMGSITEAISALSEPNTWIALATATGNGVAGYVQGQAIQVAEETAKMLQEISEQSAEVQRKYNELMGTSNNGIDLGVLNQYRSDLTERPADFFARTLVTGSDIVEITLKQIADFTRNNLKLELA